MQIIHHRMIFSESNEQLWTWLADHGCDVGLVRKSRRNHGSYHVFYHEKTGGFQYPVGLLRSGADREVLDTQVPNCGVSRWVVNNKNNSNYSSDNMNSSSYYVGIVLLLTRLLSQILFDSLSKFLLLQRWSPHRARK